MKLRIVAAASLLAACATAPQGPLAPSSSAPAAARSSEAHEAMLRSAGGRDAATLRDVDGLFGPPDIKSQDGAGALYTYRYETCALVLLFAGDGSNMFRLVDAQPGPRRLGLPAPSLSQCASEAAAAPRR